MSLCVYYALGYDSVEIVKVKNIFEKSDETREINLMIYSDASLISDNHLQSNWLTLKYIKVDTVGYKLLKF